MTASMGGGGPDPRGIPGIGGVHGPRGGPDPTRVPDPGGADGGEGETGPLDVVSGRLVLLLPLNCDRRHCAVLSPTAGASSVSVTPTLNSSRTASGTDAGATTGGRRGSVVGVLPADGDGGMPSWTELAALMM